MEKIKKLRSFLESSPNDSFLKHALALEYIKLGEEETAKNLFLEVLTGDPGYIGSYYHLARLMERTGDSQNAKAWYEKGLEEAKKAGDRHACIELQAALEDLID